MSRTFEQLLIAAAPSLFVVLWASGFIAAKFGLPYVEPLTFLTLRMIGIVILLGAVIALTRPKWPDRLGIVRSALTGLMVHGLYLGGVFVSIENGLSAGVIALLVSLQPVLTSTIANRWLGERVVPRQWLGLALGLAGVYLIVRENVAAGEAKPLAWFAGTVALMGITAGTLYQKRFGGSIDWRTGMWVQYVAAGILFALGAAVFENRVVHWTPQFIFALSWMVLVMSLGAVWLLYFLIRRSAATRVVSLFYLTPPVTALMAWLFFDERLAPLALWRHGDLRGRRVSRQLASGWCNGVMRANVRRKAHTVQEQIMSARGPIEYRDAGPEVRAVFDDIKRTRKVEDVNNFWKYLAHDPATLKRTWESVKETMAPGALDAVTKEMIYLAVSVTNGCGYCIASHGAAARKAGMSEKMFGELMAVVGMANETNRLANGYRVPIDAAFER